MFKKIVDVWFMEYLWVKSPGISLQTKIYYLIKKYYVVITKKQGIHFLGKYFYFDNRFIPFLLAMYPSEISQVIRNIPTKQHPCTVLDIGANIGQWGRTMLYYVPHARIDSFEPNPTIQTLLKKNASVFSSWRIFPYGIGNVKKNLYLYFSPLATDGGSFIADKAHSSLKRIKTSIIPLNRSIRKKYKLPDSYDIVKIDVEGMEEEVLKGLSSLNFSLLSIEVDTGRGYGLKEKDVLYILNVVQKRNMICLGVFQAHNHSPEANALFAKKHI